MYKFIKPQHDDAKEKTLAGATISSSTSIDFFAYLERTSKIKGDIWEDASKWITNDKLAGFQALFYFAKGLPFSEQYTVSYGHHLASLSVDKQPKYFEEDFMNLLRKTNCFSNILQSLYFLKHDKLANSLIEHFDWKGVFRWQQRAETREMFKLPNYSQYEID